MLPVASVETDGFGGDEGPVALGPVQALVRMAASAPRTTVLGSRKRPIIWLPFLTVADGRCYVVDKCRGGRRWMLRYLLTPGRNALAHGLSKSAPMPTMKQDAVQNIKDHNDPVDLGTEHFPPQKNGRHLKGLCPFHQEKTP